MHSVSWPSICSIIAIVSAESWLSSTISARQRTLAVSALVVIAAAFERGNGRSFAGAQGKLAQFQFLVGEIDIDEKTLEDIGADQALFIGHGAALHHFDRTILEFEVADLDRIGDPNVGVAAALGADASYLGFGDFGDAGVFGDLAARLSDRYMVVTYDQRGHSRSPLHGEPEDIPAALHADAWVTAVLAATSFVLAGMTKVFRWRENATSRALAWSQLSTAVNRFRFLPPERRDVAATERLVNLVDGIIGAETRNSAQVAHSQDQDDDD